MFQAAIMITLCLQSTINIFAVPGSASPAAFSIGPPTAQSSPATYPSPSSSQPSIGGSSIAFPVDGTSITLMIKPIPNQKIARNDLVITLYDSREYLRRESMDSWLSGHDEPFTSSAIPNPPPGNCVLKAKSQPPQHLTYEFLGDAVQGLMDYTFYPYNASVDSLAFEVNHTTWGILGGGTLTASPPVNVAK